ncbi:MAG: VOC family protein [Anaerolineae bacterium]|nr:VOC family protein [Anaerolineae bacterium]
MKLMPVVYVTNMERSAAFYRAFCDGVRSQSGIWTEFSIGDASLALHHVESLPAESRVGLAFVTAAPLEQVVSYLSAQGVTPENAITDESFGRSILVRDPDGLLIQINEHDPDLYG